MSNVNSEDLNVQLSDLDSSNIDSLDKETYFSLGTFRKNGESVCTPVWFGGERGEYYVFTNGGTGKVKRLRNSSAAKVAACDVRGNVHGTWLEAQAIIIDNKADEQSAHEILLKKYGWKLWFFDCVSFLGGRKRKRVFLRIRLG